MSEETERLFVELSDHHHALGLNFPRVDLPLSPTRILLVAADRLLAQRFLKALHQHFAMLFEKARVEFLPSVILPEPIPPESAQNLHGCWFLFPADRFELRSEAFIEWADLRRHRRLLATRSLNAFRLFQGESIPKMSEPITALEDERISSRQVPVFSVAIEGNPPALNVQGDDRGMIDLLRRTLLRLLVECHEQWRRVATHWDQNVATFLEGRIQNLPVYQNGQDDLEHPDEVLATLRDFFDLHRIAQEGHQRIRAAMEIAHRLDMHAREDLDLRWRADEVTCRLNDARLNLPERWRQPGVVFTEEFQLLRARLVTLTQKFTRQLEERDLPKASALLRSAERELRHNLTVVLLGTFSSGKSTFLNSLLHLNEDPLPTSGKPETATINVLEYGEKESAKIQFLESVDLTLLSPARLGIKKNRGRWKIHRLEIAALLAWYHAGYLDLKEAKLEHFISPRHRKRFQLRKRSEGIDQHTIRALESVLELEENYQDEQWLEKHQVPLAVKELRFVDQPSIHGVRGKVFAYLALPEVALRVDHVLIRLSSDALDGGSFVDTPGTDSAISYHHTLAHRYLERRPGSPVLYCFDGTKVGGTEDRANIDFLKGLQGEKERLFFLITKRGKCLQDQRDEADIQNKAQEMLKAAGFSGHRAYFLDSLDIRNGVDQPEWNQLVIQLREYIDRSRCRVLRHDAQGFVVTPLCQLRNETEAQAKNLKHSAVSLDQQIKDIRKRREALKELLRSLQEKADHARLGLLLDRGEDLLHRFGRVLEDLRDIDTGALKDTTRDARIRDMQDAISPLDSWPTRLVKNLQSASRYLHNHLSHRLTSIGFEMPRDTVKDVSYQLTVLRLADIKIELAKSVTERRWFMDGFIPKRSYTGQLQEKRDKLVSLLEKEKDRVRDRTIREFDQSIYPYYKQYILVLDEDLEKNLQSLTRQGGTALAEKFKEKIAYLDRCINEIQAVL